MKNAIRYTLYAIRRAWPLYVVWGAIFVIFAPALFTDKTFCLLDYSRHYYPLRAYAAACLESGLLPLWNPLIYCGYPQLGEMQVNIFYPLSLLLLLGDFVTSLEFFIVLHYLVASGSAYFLGRSLELSRGGALILAIFYSLNGHLLMSHQAPPALCSLAYLPLVVACFFRYFRHGGTSYLLFGLFALAMQITAGYPITVYQTVFALLFLWLLILIIARGNKLYWRRGMFFLLTLLAAGALAAVVLLPFLELVGFTSRVDGLGLREMVASSVPLAAFRAFFSPVYFGAPAAAAYQGPLRVAWLGAFYGGPLLLFLAIFAAWRSKRSESHCLLALAALSFVLILGETTPLAFLRRLIPGLTAIHQTGTFFSLLLLSLSSLAAIGFDLLRQRKPVNDLISYALVILLSVPVLTLFNSADKADKTAGLQYAVFLILLAVCVLLKRRGLLAAGFGILLIALALGDHFMAAVNYRQLVGEDFYQQEKLNPLPEFRGRYHVKADNLEAAWWVKAVNYEQLLGRAEALGLPDINILRGSYCTSGYGSLVPLGHGELYRRIEAGEHRLGAVRQGDERVMMAEYFDQGIFGRDAGLSIARPKPGRIEITSERAGEIVVKESYHPGWRLIGPAGTEQAGLRQLALSGLIVFRAPRAGSYVLSFEPFSFKLGLFVSLLAMCVLLVALVGGIFHHRAIRLCFTSARQAEVTEG